VKTIGTEQEFGSYLYGISGLVDATVLVKDKDGNHSVRALEMKSGKPKTPHIN
jgi:hypothetical protein